MRGAGHTYGIRAKSDKWGGGAPVGFVFGLVCWGGARRDGHDDAVAGGSLDGGDGLAGVGGFLVPLTPTSLHALTERTARARSRHVLSLRRSSSSASGIIRFCSCRDPTCRTSKSAR